MTKPVIIGNSTLFQGDCLAVLANLPDNSVHCCVTSPPYFGLRQYLPAGHQDKHLEVGAEPTPEEYITKMVNVFREVRRVLRDDGTCWINIGDSYASDTKGSGGTGKSTLVGTPNDGNGQLFDARRVDCGIPAKNLIGIPWLLAFALRADGWYLRQDIIWAKPNPMPESVTDRCTKAHEYVFLLTKSARYWYDAEAIREPCSDDMQRRASLGHTRGANGKVDASRCDLATLRGQHSKKIEVSNGRNCRSVWSIATQPFTGAHFAVMPKKLVEPCILAGCPVGGTVLDPFNGAATVGIVALEHGRQYLGIELNPEYVQLSVDRLRDATRQGQLFTLPPAHLPPVTTPTASQASLFVEAA